MNEMNEMSKSGQFDTCTLLLKRQIDVGQFFMHLFAVVNNEFRQNIVNWKKSADPLGYHLVEEAA